MKMRKPSLAIAALAIAMVATACGDDDAATPTTTMAPATTTTAAATTTTAAAGDIVATAQAAGGFTTLLAAVEAAALTETLQGEGPFTVFAPTDDAFALLPAGTVESLLDSPDARERLAGARELAERLRAEYRRHSTPPQWGTVESGIVAPLAEVRTWLRQELARREDPESLQPVDRDPVPERFAEAVQKYYEALGR